MSKRLSIVFFIVIASCILAVAGFCLMLFLAPGFSVFGIKYIRADLHEVSSGRIQISETKAFKSEGGFNGNIVIESTEIPINIIFSEDFDFYFSYHENYIGLTKSKFDDPSVSISRNANGDCVITTSEYQKFIYESSSSDRYLNVYIPLAEVGGSSATLNNLIINTKSSKITFSKEKEDSRTASFNKVEINTESSKVVYDANFHTVNFNYKTNNSIRIYGDEEKEVYATHYDLESKFGRIVIKGDVVGNVSAKTQNGDIMLESCKNLYAETKGGDVKSSNAETKISTRGIVKITTNAGSVVLGEINGNGENKITTGGGSVTVDKITDATITTKRGAIRIKSLNNGNLSSNVGKIVVEEALSSIDVNTKRGNIELGGEGLMLNNPTVFSRIGKVNLKSASGNVKIETVKSNVNFINKDSENIEIVSGKKLTATRLTGKIHLVANGNTELKFTKITDDSIVELGENCFKVIINAEQNTALDTRFYFAGKNVVRYEDEAKVKEGGVVESDANLSVSAFIKVTAKNADIHAYFKKP